MARTVDPQRRIDIAEAAFAVIRERGLEQTTMSSIAASLGMGRSTLYWYFAGISEILAFLLARWQEREAEYVAGQLSGIGHPLDMLATLVEAEVAFYTRPDARDFLILMCQLWAVGPTDQREQARKLAARQIGPVRDLLTAALGAGMANGTVRHCDPAVVVDLGLCLIDGMLTRSVLQDLDPNAILALFKRQVIDPLRVEIP